MSSAPIEIERKFLIEMPDISLLKKQNGVKIKELTQTYLQTSDVSNSRVRKILQDGKTTFVKTTKKRISSLSCYEDEYQISENRYLEELENRDPSKITIQKTRYAFPYGNHTVEIDVFPFWNDRALLEVELADESEAFSLPDFVKVIKEVSEDKRYKNTNLAVSVPMDVI